MPSENESEVEVASLNLAEHMWSQRMCHQTINRSVLNYGTTDDGVDDTETIMDRRGWRFVAEKHHSVVH